MNPVPLRTGFLFSSTYERTKGERITLYNGAAGTFSLLRRLLPAGK